MKNNTNKMTKKDLLDYLEAEKSLGYPSFKNAIIKCLINDYKISDNDAINLVYHPNIKKLIDEDINWAQHMGVEFWAKYLYNNFKL